MKKRRIIKGLGVGAALSGMLFGAGCNPQCVYGPPPDVPDETAVEETEEAQTTGFEPGSMSTETVYGPPAEETTFAPADMELQNAYGPPPETTGFDPADMEIEDVYGPPAEDAAE